MRITTHRHRLRVPRIRYRKPERGRENLERLKRWPSLMAHWRGRVVYIYSNEHEAYWRTDGCGYTSDGLEAGLFRFEEAWQRTSHAGPEKRIEFRLADNSVERALVKHLAALSKQKPVAPPSSSQAENKGT